MNENDENDEQKQLRIVEIPLRHETSSRADEGKTGQWSKQNWTAASRVGEFVDDDEELGESGTGYETLRIRNISVDTIPRDLVDFFSRGHFSVADVQVHLIDA